MDLIEVFFPIVFTGFLLAGRMCCGILAAAMV